MKLQEFVKKHLGNHKIKGKEILVQKCPICGRSKWKFSINSEKGLYQCFSGSCRAKGHIDSLFKKYNEKNEHATNSKESELKSYVCKISDNTIKFLESRGISKETIELNYFDIFSTKNNETAFVYRKGFDVHSIKNRGNDKKRFSGAKFKELTLWKLDFCDSEKPLILAEGEIDQLSYETQGIENSTTLPTGASSFGWIDTDYEKLEQFKTIIIAVDNDEAGNKCRKELVKRLPEVDNIKYIDWGIYKDANEAHMNGADLQKFIDSAKCIDSDMFADVEKDEEHETIRYGIGSKALNRMIGTIRSGEVSIITGEPGSGKSTIANQFILELAKKEKCFIFSPELKLGQFKDWVSRQLIPEDHKGYIGCEECELTDEKRYFVLDKHKTKMMKWFNKRVKYIKPTFRMTAKNMIKILEKRFRSGEIRFALIDNKMKLEFKANTQFAIYEEEREFLNDLKDLCNKYNVNVFLVAHPTKHKLDDVNQYIVKGTSEIPNLVDNIYYVARCDIESIEGTNLPKDVKEKAVEYQTGTLWKTLKAREGSNMNWQHLHFEPVRKIIKHVEDEMFFYNTDWMNDKEEATLEEMFPEFLDAQGNEF